MTTKKQLSRNPGREYRDKPLTPHAALGLKVSSALSILKVKTLYLPTSMGAYLLRSTEDGSAKLEIVLKDQPDLFKTTVEVQNIGEVLEDERSRKNR